ncbi:MAG: oxidoreductase [Gemmatimonadetes bacterium]|nr:oxidoreductase [Gemmatimonadota bacterium]
MSTSAQTVRTPRRRVREMEVEVVHVRRDTPDTTTLFMSAGDEPIEYEAGHFCTIDPHQFGELEHFTAYLEDQKGQREKPRAYSMASAPHEEHLAITIKEERYESGETPYPPLLSPLLTYYIQEGRRLVISGFTGAYTFPADVCERVEHIVHVCAGSGIVPNRSLIVESLHRADPLRHTLLFSNKTRGDVIYFEEFEALRAQYPDQLDVIHCITREDPSGIRGARSGRISEELLREVAPDPSKVMAYSCGPGITPYERRAARAKGETPEPRFVENMVALLQEHGLDKKQIRQESWG